MNNLNRIALLLCLGSIGATVAFAQSPPAFSDGSDGSFGDITLAAKATQVIALPPDGIIKAKTISIAAGAVLSFKGNVLNTPVYLLAQGDVSIAGEITVTGGGTGGAVPGQGGPGGFDGGQAGGNGVPPGAGQGPGGGLGGDRAGDPKTRFGSGSYTTVGGNGSNLNGRAYGNPLLMPLVGGSGSGGGADGLAGGGGGGAILIASNTKISLTGLVDANGGYNASDGNLAGSGGAIRLIAPIVAGSGQINVYSLGGGGAGRIRIDAIDRTGIAFNLQPNTGGVVTIGRAMQAFPAVIPRLDITKAAGMVIPPGQPTLVTLPFGSPASQIVTVQAKDFAAGKVEIEVVLVPDSGNPTTFPAEIDMSKGNPASIDVPVTIASNTLTHIFAWTRRQVSTPMLFRQRIPAARAAHPTVRPSRTRVK